MRHRAKKNDGIYQYLDTCGALASMDKAVITAAKKEYRKLYKRTWRQKRRKSEKEFTISFKPFEVAKLNNAARLHKRSRSRFIKEATLAYIQKQFLVIDIVTTNEIKQLLLIHYGFMTRLLEERIVPDVIGKYLVVKMSELEQSILNRLENPNVVTGDN